MGGSFAPRSLSSHFPMRAAADFFGLRCEPVTKQSRPGDLQKTTTVREDGTQVIPVVAEELEIATRRVVRGTVRVDKHIARRTRRSSISRQSRKKSLVEHLPVNTVVEGNPPRIHEEDGVLVIPRSGRGRGPREAADVT